MLMTCDSPKEHGNKGRKLTEAHKRAIGRAGLGRKHSSATKRKISKANKGKKLSAEVCAHLSKIRRGRPAPWVRERLLGRKIKLSKKALARLIRANKSRALPKDERKRRRSEASRHQALKARYGISAMEYDKLLAKQRGVCWICRSVCSSGMRLAVDHDRETKKVRGLLCRCCNRGLGHFTLATTRQAIGYLLRAKTHSAAGTASRSPPSAPKKKRTSEDYRQLNLRWRYGMTVADYEKLLAAHRGVCGICKATCKSGKRLAIDHDHKTNKIRGLLCTSCNLGIGHFTLKTLRRTIEYLVRERQSCS